MKINAHSFKKSAAALVRMAAYLLAVTLTFSAISALRADTPVVTSENGVLDLTGFDFGGSAVAIPAHAFTMYPGAFYMPEDFADGTIAQTGVPYDSPGEVLGDYGTVRLALMLPPGQTYAISGLSVSYAQRLFIGGMERAPIGTVGTSADAVIPRSARYLEGFTPETGAAELVIHYSAFVHADGGGLYYMHLGLPGSIARAEQLRTFHAAVTAAALTTAMLFFFGLFLFFSRSEHLLWFALTCGCIALRGALTGDKALMTLLPDLSWYLAIRLEYLSMTGMAVFSALYICALFPGAVSRWAVRGFAAACAAAALFICLAPTVVFTRFAAAFTVSYSAVVICFAAAIAVAALRRRTASPLSGAEQALLLLGLCAYILLSVAGIKAHQQGLLLFGMDYPAVGMMVFLFINILTLALGFSRTEGRLALARRAVLDAEAHILALTEEKQNGTKVAERFSAFRLTKREAEVAWLILDGKSRNEIAELLCISRGTVNTYYTSIYRKAGSTSEAEFIRAALAEESTISGLF